MIWAIKYWPGRHLPRSRGVLCCPGQVVARLRKLRVAFVVLRDLNSTTWTMLNSFKLSLRVPCPLCKAKIPADAKRCRHCAGDLTGLEVSREIDKSSQRKRRITFWALGILAVLILISVLGSEKTELAPTQSAEQEQSISALTRERFDQIATAIPELNKIECLNNDCSSSVVYFDFAKVPSDLDSIIRGNTATFSKFRKDNSSGSHVTIIARLNGSQIMKCDGSSGRVDKCE